MSENKRKAVIYVRVSTKEQVDEGNSLKTQQKICSEFALKNHYEVADIFIEQGESAKTADRTELKKLLHYCAQKKNTISAVIVYKLDRLSRNIDDYSQIRILLRRYGVEIKSVSEFFEDNPAGRFMENIIANVAQFDNDVRTERSVGGMKEAVREGRYVWPAPIGYSNAKVNGKPNIILNDKATLVKQMFEEVAKNTCSIDEIRVRFFNKNILTQKNKPISRSYFYTMLKNELYAGWLNKFGERHKGIFEPIISDALFEQVQTVLRGRNRKALHYHFKNPDFPLRRFIKDETNNPLTGGWSKGRLSKHAYYRFIRCSKSFRKQSLEEDFASFMDSFKFNNSTLKKLKSQLYSKLNKNNSNLILRKDEIEKQITSLQDKETVLIQKNIDGIIPDDLLQKQLALLQIEINQAKSILSQIPEQLPDFTKLLNFVEGFLKNPGTVWKNLSFERKIKLQWFKFPSGVVFDGNEFRTTEISSLFNPELPFRTDLSSVVHHRVSGLNTLNSTNIPYLKKEVPVVKSQHGHSIEKIGNELVILYHILKTDASDSVTTKVYKNS